METIALHGPRLGVGRLCRALAVHVPRGQSRPMRVILPTQLRIDDGGLNAAVLSNPALQSDERVGHSAPSRARR